MAAWAWGYAKRASTVAFVVLWMMAMASVSFVRAARAADAPHEPTYLIKRGDTIGRLAREYKVSEDAIRALNGLQRRAVIKAGQTIMLPAPDDASPSTTRNESESPSARTNASSAVGAIAGHKPGLVHLVRGAESTAIPLLDRRRRQNSTALNQLAYVLRYSNGEMRKIDPRLATLIALVSDHFGGRDIIVVSGYRPYSPSQYTPHSNHNIGRAVDFVVRGIANERVRDYCRGLRNVGVGYYPNSTFIHLDVRDSSAYWVDYAGPGQRPRYRRSDGGGEADEGAGEVPLDTFRQTRFAPGDLVPSSDDEMGGARTAAPGMGSLLRNNNAGREPSDSTGETSVFPGQH